VWRLLTIKGPVGIPRRYEHCTLDNFTPSNLSQVRALAVARKFAESAPCQGRQLFIAGEVGVGKTHLAVGILKELLPRFGESAAFVDFPNLFEGGSCNWSRLHRIRLLVLDSFGQIRPCEDRLNCSQELLQSRLGSGRLTVLTGGPVRSRMLFRKSLPSNASDTEIFLAALPPALVFQLLNRTRILSLEGEDFRHKSSRIAALV
jgi:DNA replication protein DnaC